MSNRYWIGNSGSWNDTAHWSTTSGGSGGASVPSTSDAVILDANSFSLTGQTVIKPSNCASFNSSTVTNNPTLDVSGVSGLYKPQILGDFNCTGTTWTSFSLASQYLRLRGTGAVTVTTGGVQLPNIDWENNNNGDVTYTIADNLAVKSCQWSYMLPTTDNGVVNIVATGRTLTWPNVHIFCNPATIDNCTINVTEKFQQVDGGFLTCSGTTWVITGTILNLTTDPTFGSLAGSSTSSRTVLTNNSGTTQTLSNLTLRNTTLNGTSGFLLEKVIDDGGNDWGGGGGGPGNPPRQIHVKLPPDYTVLP